MILSNRHHKTEFVILFSIIALTCCFMPLLYTTDYHNFYQWFPSSFSYEIFLGDVEGNDAKMNIMYSTSRALADIVFSHKPLIPMGK